jgi:hypothetical protein
MSIKIIFHELYYNSTYAMDPAASEGRLEGIMTAIERTKYLQEVEEYMKNLSDVDIFAVSAGFDQGIDDWGALLYPEDYTELGRLIKEYSDYLKKDISVFR